MADKLTPNQRLQLIAEILERHDTELLAADGPVPQEPLFMRQIYLLAIGKMPKGIKSWLRTARSND